VLTSAEGLAHLSLGPEPVVEEGGAGDMDLLRPTDKAFEKLAAETEQVNPATAQLD
jgi:hypothetical protein